MIFTKIKTWAIAALVFMSGLLIALLKGRAEGKKVARDEQQAHVAVEAAKAQKEVTDVQVDVSSRPDGDAGKQLRDDWMRD